jgi:hypothetical protein
MSGEKRDYTKEQFFYHKSHSHAISVMALNHNDEQTEGRSKQEINFSYINVELIK